MWGKDVTKKKIRVNVFILYLILINYKTKRLWRMFSGTNIADLNETNIFSRTIPCSKRSEPTYLGNVSAKQN